MRRAMLIAPSFFGYCRDIANELEEHGFTVQIVSDRPSESVAFKTAGKISYAIVQHKIESYCTELCKRLLSGSFDLVLFVGGMSICFDRNQMTALRVSTKARFGLYLWDSLRNCQRIGESLDLFDAVLSFEPEDCRVRSLSFLPLFYTREYARIANTEYGEFEYDACFIGSVHQPSKFKNVRHTVEALRSNGARVFCHYYMPSRSVSALRKAQHPFYRGVEFRYSALSREDVTDIYGRTRTIIDSPQQGQSGLTMRTIESVGANRRLLTTNVAVREYDFFKCGNVGVLDSGEFDCRFAMRDPKPIDSKIREKYSIATWMEKVLSQLGVG